MEQNVLQLVLRVRDEATKELQKFSGVVQKSTDNFKANLGAAGTMSATFIGALGLMTKAAVANASTFEQNRIAFETMLGSAGRAKSLLQEVGDFAAKTPFELPQVVEGSKRLLAYNISAEKIIPTFKMLGDIASGVGVDKLPQLITAFGQVGAKGKLMGQELLQFTEAGVGLGGELQKMLGISRDQLEEMIGTGKIGFGEVEKALQGMTNNGGLFFDGMVRQSKSLNGMLSNINDVMGKFIRELVGIDSQGEIREGSLFAVLRDAAQQFMVALEKARPIVVKFVTELLSHKEVVIAIAGALGGLVVLAIVALISAIGGALVVMAQFALIGAAVALVVALIIRYFNDWKAKAIEVIEYIKTIPSRIGEFIVNTVMWFIELDSKIRHFFIDLFLVHIPYAIGYVAGYLSKAIPDMITGVISWFSSLPERVSEGLSNFGNVVKNRVLSIGAFIQTQFSQMPDRINNFISSIPGIFSDIFEKAKQAVLDKINGIWKGITGTFKKIGDLLSGIISGGGNVIEKIVNAAKSGFTAGQDTYAEGGYVRRTGSALVHQGEFVLSKDMLSGRVGIPASVADTFNQPINIQAVIGSEMDLNLLGYRIAWALRNAR